MTPANAYVIASFLDNQAEALFHLDMTTVTRDPSRHQDATEMFEMSNNLLRTHVEAFIKDMGSLTQQYHAGTMSSIEYINAIREQLRWFDGR
jgi:hypothetical protein